MNQVSICSELLCSEILSDDCSRCVGCCDCSSPHGSAVRVCGLHCLPGDSAPSIRAHTTTKGSLVSKHVDEQMNGIDVFFPNRFYKGHISQLRKPGRFRHDTYMEWCVNRMYTQDLGELVISTDF